MKKSLTVLMIIFFGVTAFAVEKATLTVKVTGLNSSKGYVVCHLFNNPDGYPTKSKKAMKYINDYSIGNKTAIFVFKDLPFGEYAFTVHHDENANHKMDKNLLGMPKEGWACSNNTKGVLGIGPPSFEKAKIQVRKFEVTVNIKMNY